jgi:phosphohistidine phosphatase SixA
MHLFLEDFTSFLSSANAQTYKALTKAFDHQDHKEALKQTIYQQTFKEQFTLDNPLTEKLSVYVLAHRNYLASLTLSEIKDSRINWGLKE